MKVIVGYKLLCKKDLTVRVGLDRYLTFTSGEFYEVVDISPSGRDVEICLGDDMVDYSIDFSLIPIDDIKFVDLVSFYYIWNYFFTPKEIRKLKLGKLNSL